MAIAENDTRVVSSRRSGHVGKRKIATTEEQPKPTAELRREGRLARIAKALASGAQSAISPKRKGSDARSPPEKRTRRSAGNRSQSS
jgi:hypothetical protein